jgi:hypothetical protein
MRHTHKIKLMASTALGFALLSAVAATAWAQETPPPETSSPMAANELAKEISNPVTSLWQLQFQFNNMKLEGGNSFPTDEAWTNRLYFQPIMPVSLTKSINLVTRPVITVYNRVPVPTGPDSYEQETDFGDMIMANVLSPAGFEPWIFGIGPTWIFPTAGSDYAGQGKWQVGPAAGGGYITTEFMVALFGQQWWSFAGDDDRKDTSQMQLKPLMYRFFGEGWSVGYSGDILADWKADSGEEWAVPLGLSVGKVAFLGKLPVQFQIAGEYFVERPTGGPEWNAQFQITPVLPKLITGTLFK